ncbi:putative solute carrier family 22 member 31 isoform X2 [Sminthopsis crassicaudata]|uniref:putative solute carrier family 22 member 31 isoform X2 n=1 Tax=Sminthopsis crassicaudata TaxID=9301 RepID=UPI003D69301F
MDLDALGVFTSRTWNARLRLVVAASWLPNVALALALNSDWLMFAAPPAHHCRPDLALLPPTLRSLAGPALLNVSLPRLPPPGTWSPCRLLRYPGPDPEPNGTRPCTRGWEFARPASGLLRTPIIQWNLVCEDTWKVPLQQIIYLLGWLLGCMILGSACDRYGRRTTFVTSLALATVLGSGIALSVNYPMLLSLRLFFGATVAGAFLSLYVARLEICDPDHRLSVTMVSNFFFIVGTVAVLGLAVLCQDWRLLQGVVTFILGLVLLFWGFPFLLPESPRWLVVTQQLERAKRALWRMAETNFNPNEPSSMNIALDKGLDRLFSMKSLPQYHSICEVFSAHLTWRNILILSFISLLGHGIRYSFLQYLLPFLPPFYMPSFLLNGLEGLASLLLIPMAWCYGRRATLLLCTVITSLTSLFLLSLYQFLPMWTVIFLSGLGLLASHAMSVFCIFFSSEILPTVLSQGRNLPESLEDAEDRQSSLLFLPFWATQGPHVPLLPPPHQRTYRGRQQHSGPGASVSSPENGDQRHESIWNTLLAQALGTRRARRVRVMQAHSQ